jgi:hypothetical protein
MALGELSDARAAAEAALGQDGSALTQYMLVRIALRQNREADGAVWLLFLARQTERG